MPFDPSFNEPGFYEQPYALPSQYGGSSMPAAVVAPAAISAAGSLISGIMGSRAQGKATQAQQQANAQALAFEREKYANQRSDYQSAMDAYKQQWLAGQARKDALLSRYGFDTGGMPSGMSSSAPRAAAPAAGPAMGAPSMAAAAPQAQGIASLMQRPVMGGGGDPSAVFDWSKYGLAPKVQ